MLPKESTWGWEALWEAELFVYFFPFLWPLLMEIKEEMEKGTSFSCPLTGPPGPLSDSPGPHTWGVIKDPSPPKHPRLDIFGPRVRGTDEMAFREPPGSGPGLSQRPKPGRGAGTAFHPLQLLPQAQLRHWERTRKYQWALLGLITHSKGMTSISLDFLGTCLQLES